jgi:hypothetical protein
MKFQHGSVEIHERCVFSINGGGLPPARPGAVVYGVDTNSAIAEYPQQDVRNKHR